MWQRLLRIVLGGVAAALIVLAAGWMLQRTRLGVTEADARTRVEADVRQSFAVMAAALRSMTATVGDAKGLRLAESGDTAAARGLFVSAAAAIAGNEEQDVALTLYSADGQPLAWAGRPSELPRERLTGPAAWFFARGTLGLRLVYVTPVTDGPSRVGTIAAERAIVSAADQRASRTAGRASDSESYRFPTRLAPVSIELPFEGATTRRDDATFQVSAPSGAPLLTARLDPQELVLTRDKWWRTTFSLALIVLAITMAVSVGALLDWRNRAKTVADYVATVCFSAGAILAARLLLRFASPADWSGARLFSGAAYASTALPPFLTSAFDFLMTMLAAGGLVGLALFAFESWRISRGHIRRSVSSAGRLIWYLAAQLLAGGGVALVLLAHDALVRDTISHTTLDLLHFSLHPLTSARIALQVGLILAHAIVAGVCVLVLRMAQARWRVPRRDWRLRLVTAGCWLLPLTIVELRSGEMTRHRWPLLFAAAVIAGLTIFTPRLKARYRHGSQAFRLTLLTLALVVPAFAFYPAVFQLAWDARSRLVEGNYAPQARNQRTAVQTLLTQSLDEIDRSTNLAELIGPALPRQEGDTLPDPYRAFQVWQRTSLASPITSSVELYAADGSLVSRFAFNLPEDLTATSRSDERSCDWEVYAEVAPFFTEERRVLRAARAICEPGSNPRILGSIVVHAMVDYENLEFISSRSPYTELLRSTYQLRGEDVLGRDVEFVFYGWSGTPLYSSRETAWQLADEVLAKLVASRDHFWARLRRGEAEYDVYLLNDRGGIYALGFPVATILDHAVNLAEVFVLAAGTFVLLLAASALFGWLSGRRSTAPALLREIRASFYRKLFLAFVAAVTLPVVALAVVTRNYFADEITANVQQEAVRTASAARRVVEDLIGPRAAQQAVGVDDNLMVWVSRLIDQDVNVFSGARLLATSERSLFAYGLMPTRTPAQVYLTLALRKDAATAMRDRIEALEFLVAATPVAVRQFDAILTVSLTSRQQEIDAQIDTLDRRVLLGALLFILAGAGLGYSMAERISDPVNRLTRATRRIARGDLDARIPAATSSDELRRLVEDFNRMADDLKQQRQELERTHRLEAWAEMARQVAHEIKNPLTPIQLNAEHLRRVHADRGEPLGPVLQDCVATILTQVKLLRQIASEFSSFASSPTARASVVNVGDLIHEIVEPYKVGLADRIRFELDIPQLPPVWVDRTLIARSLTNIVENALHAMPAAGSLTIVARAADERVTIRVSDTGVGMDAEALARAFEPYFSTKASGTGLGLPIAKRNVELSGGTISVTSERDRGTTVELTLPISRS